MNGTNILKIVPLSFMSVSNVYTLFTFSGSNASPAVNLTNLFRIQPPSSGFFAFTVIDPTNNTGSLQIMVTKAVGNDVWTGTNSVVSRWDFNSPNWARNNASADFNSGDFVTFDDTSTPKQTSTSMATS